jgi:hypothetical protein
MFARKPRGKWVLDQVPVYDDNDNATLADIWTLYIDGRRGTEGRVVSEVMDGLWAIFKPTRRKPFLGSGSLGGYNAWGFPVSHTMEDLMLSAEDALDIQGIEFEHTHPGAEPCVDELRAALSDIASELGLGKGACVGEILHVIRCLLNQGP